MSNWKTIEVTYETQNLPAPFSFEIKAVLQREKDLKVEFHLKYTDRDELDEEEILDEGFTGDDNIEWQGNLPDVWTASADALLEKTTWTKKVSPISQSNITVFIDKVSQGHPANADKWEYWLQELQQAGMEADNIEKPLEIDYQKGNTKIAIKASFVNRTASIQDFTEAAVEKPLEWSLLRKFLKHIYQAEFIPGEAVKQPDAGGDPFLNLGGGQWYNLQKANLHLPKKKDWLEKLTGLMLEQVNGPSA